MAENNQTDKMPPPLSEGERIRDRKRQVIDTLSDKFNQPIWRDRLLKICGGDESRIMKALNSFLTYVMNDDGGKEGNKSYIADCGLASISTAFLEAFQMGIEVGGGRDHAYLVNYAGQCELDISYKGFVYALNKHFDNAFVDARCVFKDDIFTCEITDTTATFTHKPANPFNQTWERLEGCYCYFSYTLKDSGMKVSRLIMIPRGTDAKSPDTLEMIRSKAKGSWAWKDFPFEQCKKATIRRATKIPFASIDFSDEDVNPETVDNRHYQLEGGSSDRLRLMMDKHKEILEDENKPQSQGDRKAEEATAKADLTNDPAKLNNTENPNAGENSKPIIEAQAVVSPEAGGGANPEDNSGFQELSDDDFCDADSAAGGIIDQQPAIVPMMVPITTEGLTIDQPSTPIVWDGQTIMIGGKAQKRDFATPGQAAVYLKKVISQRKHKSSRIAIINENPNLVATLIRAGNGKMIEDLHKLADQGE